MRRIHAVPMLILLCSAALFLSCAALRQGVPHAGTPQREFDLREYGYNDAILNTFYYTEGVKAARLAGDTATARRLLLRTVGRDSTYAPGYFELANIAMLSDPEAALGLSRKANRYDTANVWYQTQLAQLMIMNERYAEALDQFNRLIRLAPNNPDNYRYLAALYEQNKQPFSAIAVLDSAETKFGRIEELAAYKRQLLIDVQLIDRAIAETRAMTASFPYDEDNYLTLAQLYATQKKDSLARQAFDQARMINPRSTRVLMALNAFYKQNNDFLNYFATAKQLLLTDDLLLSAKLRYIGDLTQNRNFYGTYYMQIGDLIGTLNEKYPADPEVIKLYADHLLSGGELDQALDFYKSHTRDSVQQIMVYENIIGMETYLQRTDSIAKYTAIALSHFPDDVDLHLQQGSALAYLKDYKSAKATYETAYGMAASDSLRGVVLGLLGDLAHQQGDARKSYKYYDRSLKLYPDNPMVLNNYSYYLSTSDRDLDRALTMAARTIELAPGNPTYLDTYAWALYKLGRYAEAKKTMQQAISLERNPSEELLVHYGDILYALKENFLASVYWKKAEEAGYDPAAIAERMKLIENK